MIKLEFINAKVREKINLSLLLGKKKDGFGSSDVLGYSLLSDFPLHLAIYFLKKRARHTYSVKTYWAEIYLGEKRRQVTFPKG